MNEPLATSIVPYGAADLRARVNNLRTAVMEKDIDYGTIPGSDKMILLKPGAEKMCSEFGFYPRFEQVNAIEDFNPERPLFHYRYRAVLYRISDGAAVAEGIGSCNSMEKKYRYRQSERTCPSCGKATIIKGKAEFGGGWLCFKKKGGCGAKFDDGDSQITDQQVGQSENPDIFDQINTLDKMAQKRALVAAVLIATNASAYFTQDLEDYDVVDGSFQEVPRNAPKSHKTAPSSDVRPDAAVNGHENGNAPSASQNGHSEVWPSEDALNGLFQRVNGKDGLAPGATIPDIERWAKIEDALNIDLWAKYETRAAAALAIKEAYEKEQADFATSDPANIQYADCKAARYAIEKVNGRNQEVIRFELESGNEVVLIGREMLRKLSPEWRTYCMDWQAAQGNGTRYVFSEADAVKYGAIDNLSIGFDPTQKKFSQVISVRAVQVTF